MFLLIRQVFKKIMNKSKCNTASNLAWIASSFKSWKQSIFMCGGAVNCLKTIFLTPSLVQVGSRGEMLELELKLKDMEYFKNVMEMCVNSKGTEFIEWTIRPFFTISEALELQTGLLCTNQCCGSGSVPIWFFRSPGSGNRIWILVIRLFLSYA